MLWTMWWIGIRLCAALVLLTGGAVVVGLAKPPHPALASFVEGCESKPAPCWKGIVPGVTTGTEILDFLHTTGSYRFSGKVSSFAGGFKVASIPFVCSFVVRVLHDVVEEVQIRYCNQEHIFVGDVAGQLGVPPSVSPGYGRSLIYGDTAPRFTPQGERWSPYDRTVSIILTANT